MILEPKQKRTAATAWLKRVNPLQGLSITQAKNVFDVARAHGSPLLQKIYDEIELTDPVLMTCVERRQSALSGLGWRAVANASAPDPDRAEEQRRRLEEFANGIENLDEAIEHLDLAFFRGFSVVQPIWENNAPKVRRVNLLNSWNFLKGDDGRLMWNPNCTLDPNGCEEITADARTVQLVRRRAIDWPALIIHIRSYLGERDWGRFLERYGIPPVDAVMAPNATTEQRDEYLACGEAAREGRTVAWPSGTNVNRAEGSRGQDPFSAFIEHQEKLIVLMATGGTLTSLAQADTGALAGGAQMDVWTQIVRRDGVVISAALNRQLFIPFLREAFPGDPAMAHFELGREDEMSADEAADLAGKLQTAGYTVDQSQLEEATGFKLEKATEPAPQGPLDAPFMRNKAPTALQNAEKPLQNAPRVPDGQGDVPDHEALLRAFSRDLSPAAEEVKRLLADLDAGKDVADAAKSLVSRLDTLMPEDPAMASVLAEAMAKEFGATVKNSTDANGASHSDANGQFDGGNGGSASESPKAKARREKHEWRQKAGTQGIANMATVKSGADCPDFMPGVTISGGKKFDRISFYNSDYRHIRDHVQGDVGGGKAAYNHQAMLVGSKIPDTITKGAWYLHHGDYVAVEGKDKAVVMSLDGKGLKVKSAYESADKVNEIRTGGFQRVFNKEDFDESH